MKEEKILCAEDFCANLDDELRREGWKFEKEILVKKEVFETRYVFVREK